MESIFSRNYFELFGLPVSFEVDLNTLSEHYRELQRVSHPDKFANATDQERRLAVQQAAQINEAFRVLKDPLERGKYLLALQGINLDEETDTSMDPQFLMQQMELRESLEAVRDAQDPLGKLAGLLQEIEKAMSDMISDLSVLFANANDEAYTKARDTVRKMQFMHKLRNEIEELEEELI
ncbi:MAG: co-chaperone HscB [Gammaproteobacteria bacterium]|nr:co-chaperone HscB [Gammaproteobacteria bacterium]MDH5593825.1 co-chaperone HscB [Gammaproteobacteria bacterium]